MTATNLAEHVILVNEQNVPIGTAEKLLAHKNNLLHRAFSIFIFRKQPSLELLLQQRSFDKYHSAGLWTNTCCSHPRSDESIIEAGQRRLKEELGISTELKELGWFHYNARFDNGLFENEIDHVLVGTITSDILIRPSPKEIHAYRWVTLDMLQQELSTQPKIFTPWLSKALEIVIKANV